jgi:hypothetical protein
MQSKEKQVEEAIRTTLVVKNGESIKYAVDKIMRVFEPSEKK